MDPLFAVHKLNAVGMEKARVIAEAFDSQITFLRKVSEYNGGRSFALVQTHLELACFYAKKAMAMQPENQAVEESLDSKAERAFNAYNDAGPNPWKTWDGKDVPRWPDLNEQVRAKWRAAVSI